MRFLIDACLPKEFAEVVAQYGHVAIDVRDIGMARADDPDIAAYAQRIVKLRDGRIIDDHRRDASGAHSTHVAHAEADHGVFR